MAAAKATATYNFGQALPIMESRAALASSIVAYLPNSLYLALLVEVSSLPGMIRHCLVVDHEVKHLSLSQDGLRGTYD